MGKAVAGKRTDRMRTVDPFRASRFADTDNAQPSEADIAALQCIPYN
jgi:hypothetical protein